MTIHILYYISVVLLLIGQVFNVYGSFINSTNPKATIFQTYWLSLPYMIIQRILTMWSIYIMSIYKYMSNNQIVMTILVMQFIITLILSNISLHKPIYFSDIVGGLIILVGFYMSMNKAYSTYLVNFVM